MWFSYSRLTPFPQSNKLPRFRRSYFCGTEFNDQSIEIKSTGAVFVTFSLFIKYGESEATGIVEELFCGCNVPVHKIARCYISSWISSQRIDFWSNSPVNAFNSSVRFWISL